MLYVTSKLSVSQENKLDCEKMAFYLSENNIVTSITSNISCQPKIEYGCNLTQSISSKKDISKIWTLLQRKYNFKCGHLKVGDAFDGCVLNFLAESKCNN